MKNIFYCLLLAIILGTFVACQATNAKSYQENKENAKSIHSFTVKDIDGNIVPLSSYKGKVLVIVNTASKCGLVEQLGELEKFYQAYKDKGVVVLGFPANNFLSQEPLGNSDIKAFCSKNYGVTFPMFEKISVKGDDIAPLYKFLTNKSENGVADAPIKWNYQKFIIDKNGFISCSISPRTSVNDEEFLQALQDALK
jgi:glutathione peroxidase